MPVGSPAQSLSGPGEVRNGQEDRRSATRRRTPWPRLRRRPASRAAAKPQGRSGPGTARCIRSACRTENRTKIAAPAKAASAQRVRQRLGQVRERQTARMMIRPRYEASSWKSPIVEIVPPGGGARPADVEPAEMLEYAVADDDRRGSPGSSPRASELIPSRCSPCRTPSVRAGRTRSAWPRRRRLSGCRSSRERTRRQRSAMSVTPSHSVTAAVSSRGASGNLRVATSAITQIAAAMATMRSSMRTGMYVPETPTSGILG